MSRGCQRRSGARARTTWSSVIAASRRRGAPPTPARALLGGAGTAIVDAAHQPDRVLRCHRRRTDGERRRRNRPTLGLREQAVGAVSPEEIVPALAPALGPPPAADGAEGRAGRQLAPGSARLVA